MNRAKEVKCMKKSDLVAGNHMVQYRNGTFRFVGRCNGLLDTDGVYVYSLEFYNERLEDVGGDKAGDKAMDIVAVYELNEVWKREEPTITEDEKAILRNLPADYEWIARDGRNSELYIYPDKPDKHEGFWMAKCDYRSLDALSHLFVMVKWEDDEPWKIEDLLKLDVKEDK